jgi:NADPH2:quinone reductase
MRAIEAKTFSGYGLQQIELLKPQPAQERVLVRITTAGVTPLDHTMTRSLRVPRKSLNSKRKRS